MGGEGRERGRRRRGGRRDGGGGEGEKGETAYVYSDSLASNIFLQPWDTVHTVRGVAVIIATSDLFLSVTFSRRSPFLIAKPLLSAILPDLNQPSQSLPRR